MKKKEPYENAVGRLIEMIRELDETMKTNFSNIQNQINHLGTVMDEKFRKVDEKFQQIDEKFQRIDERFQQIDERFDRMDERLTRVESKMDEVINVNRRVESLEEWRNSYR